MDKIYSKGELLQVHTSNNEVFEGRFHSVNTDKSKISLYNVKELPKGEESEGICHFYSSEVRNITKTQSTDELASNLIKNLKISQRDCEEIAKISKKYIFINQCDNTFYDALEALSRHPDVAVGTEGATMGRKCKLPCLTLSTPHQIYILDIQVMQHHAFDGPLKKLLESEYPKKIIHNSRRISDCLYHKHNVQLRSVFDTQVGDLIIAKNKTGRLPNNVKSLQECLNTYLGLPLSTKEDKLDLAACTERPLSADTRARLARGVAPLHRLAAAVRAELAWPLERGVACYLDSLRACDDFAAWDQCGKDPHPPQHFKHAIQY